MQGGCAIEGGQREIVGTFATLELALAEVDKAKRAKKAALEIL